MRFFKLCSLLTLLISSISRSKSSSPVKSKSSCSDRLSSNWKINSNHEFTHFQSTINQFSNVMFLSIDWIYLSFGESQWSCTKQQSNYLEVFQLHGCCYLLKLAQFILYKKRNIKMKWIPVYKNLVLLKNLVKQISALMKSTYENGW